jgi:hypothetical protein
MRRLATLPELLAIARQAELPLHGVVLQVPDGVHDWVDGSYGTQSGAGNSPGLV